MFYFKQIDVKNNICNELKSWCMDNIQTNNVPFVLLDSNKFINECPLFLKWASDQDLKIKLVVGIKVNAHNEQIESKTPHIDLMDDERNIALNFPIKNCDNTYTTMYKLKKGDQIDITLPDGTAYSKFSDDSEFEEVETFYLKKPTFFNTGIPHQVFNNTDDVRLSLSIRFERNPKFN